MLYTEITEDRTGEDGLLRPVLSMGEIYLNNYPKLGEDHSKYPKAPIDLVWNRQSCLLQNKQTIDRGALYDVYFYESSVNESMVKHLRDVVRLALSHVHLQEGDLVLDIASNDGTLLRHYKKETLTQVTTVGYDPAKNLAEKAKQGVNWHFPICFDATHFADTLQFENTRELPKIITACAVVYHTPEPVKFLKDIADSLHPEGVFVCEFTYLPTMLKNNAIDSIGHEHLTHLSLMSFEKMLKHVGLEIVFAELGDINAGTIICVIKHSPSYYSNMYDLAWLEALRTYEWQLKIGGHEVYKKWAEKGKFLKRALRELLEELHKEGKSVYLYGASTKASILLQWIGMDNKLIQAAVERNPWKVGREMVGLKIPIINEDRARQEMPDVMLVGPWCFRKEFIEREKEYLKAGGRMIFPLPKLEIVDGSCI